MTTFTTDNRYGAGASGANVPEGTFAAYAARWIDHGDRADIVPDRQGFAYATEGHRHALISALLQVTPHLSTGGLSRDVTTVDIYTTDEVEHGITIVMRRAGGYVYVDAWLTVAEHRPEGGGDPYGTGPVLCECGVELEFTGDHDQEAWAAADGSEAPCPVWS
jgi:hypothetical protein